MKEHVIINPILIYRMVQKGNTSTSPDKLVKEWVLTSLPFYTNTNKIVLGQPLPYLCHPALDAGSPINKCGFLLSCRATMCHDRRKQRASNEKFIIIKLLQSSCIL